MDCIFDGGMFYQTVIYDERYLIPTPTLNAPCFPISGYGYTWENDDYYRFPSLSSNTETQYAEILSKFASKILAKTVDPDPRISDLVDKHFWDML